MDRSRGARRCAHSSALLLPFALALACCSEAPKESPAPLSTGLNSLEPAATSAAESDSATQAKLDLMAQAQQHSNVSVDAPPPARSPRSRPAPAEPTIETPAEPAPSPEPIAESPPPTAAPQAPSRESLVAELAAQLRDQARSSSAPAAALLRLASLELLESKAGDADPASEAALTPQEAEFVTAWRELFAAARDGLNSSGDLAPLTAQVVSLAERVQAAQPLSVIESRLCTTVDGFGMFDEMKRRDAAGPYIFVAGKRQRAIVYIEVMNYTHTAETQRGVDGFQVRLSQELQLFHAAADAETVVWSRPFQEINDFSRKRRRDFYTTQVIDLPANLGVGSYRLKVSLSDKPSAAVAEAIIPIEFVAEGAGK